MTQNSAKNASLPTGQAGGDLTGAYPDPQVSGLQGYPVANVVPTNGYSLTWDQVDGYWKPAPSGGGSTAVIFETTVISAPENITSNRQFNQSPTQIPGSYRGIVNLSSDTGGVATGANGNFVTISGGDKHNSTGDYNVIGGGWQNTTTSSSFSTLGTPGGSTIAGGSNNTIYCADGFIGGGTSNFLTSASFGGVISGGDLHYVNGIYSTVGGGEQNSISGGFYSTIGGGFSNTINALYSTISGGYGNNLVGSYAFIGGGQSNQISNDYGVISGGFDNISSGTYTTISGGYQNNVSGNCSTVVGGQSAVAQNSNAIAGGYYCHSNGDFAVSMGYNNFAIGQASVTLGFGSYAPRFGQMSFSSSSGNISKTIVPGAANSDAQSGHVVYAAQQTTPGTSFVLTDGGSIGSYTGSEFSVAEYLTIGYSSYFSMTIRIVATANNAFVGPATWVWEVLFHSTATSGTVIDSSNLTYSSDPNTTGWTSSITVDPGLPSLHININPNADTTNTINAVADIKWVESYGFAQ